MATNTETTSTERLVKTYPFCAYIRVSSQRQADDDRDGLDRQKEAISSFAKANGYTINPVRWFQDAVTGTTDDLSQRVGFSNMIDCLKETGYKVVIVESADRIARDLMVQEILIEKLRRLKVLLLDKAGNDLTVLDNNPIKVMVRQILGAVAQYQKADLCLRMRMGRAAKVAETGLPCGGNPSFGKREGDDERLKLMKKLRKKGFTLQAIADTLNADKIPTPMHKSRPKSKWSAQSVNVFLMRCEDAKELNVGIRVGYTLEAAYRAVEAAPPLVGSNGKIITIPSKETRSKKARRAGAEANQRGLAAAGV